MFFHIELKKSIRLHPRHFGPHLESRIKSRLHAEVEGSCSARYGYIVSVTEILSTGKGLIKEGMGEVEFKVKYKAIVFKPFPGEVLDGIVSKITEVGVFCDIGSVKVFISHTQLDEFSYDEDAAQPRWVDANATTIIQIDTVIRLKITTVNFNENNLFCIGTMTGNHLGVI